MRDIWEMDCALRDAILWSSFTAQELEQVSKAVRFPLQRCDHLDSTLETMIAAHRACSVGNDFSVRVQELLDRDSEEAASWIEVTDPEDLFLAARGPLDEIPAALPQVLWAVARLGERSLGKIQQVLEWRLMTEGVRRYTFGKVELIEV